MYRILVIIFGVILILGLWNHLRSFSGCCCDCLQLVGSLTRGLYGFKSLQRPQLPLERWFMHYSSLHKILLVGEGDFSFSSTLATKFGCASNIVATSLDSREKVLRLYKAATNTIFNLMNRGARVLHGVDATRMDQLVELRGECFDRIIFNFPHAGFFGKEDDPEVLKKHRNLMSKFFRSAAMLLAKNGQIHVNHKMGEPYDRWNLEDEAWKCGLFLCKCVDFKISDYQGYINKRGDGARIDESFALGHCKTYMFMLTYGAFIERELLLAERGSQFSPLKRRYESVGEEEVYRPVKRQRMESTYNSFNASLNLQRASTFLHRASDYVMPRLPQRIAFPSDSTVSLTRPCDFIMPREIRERRMFGIPLPNLNFPWLRL